MITYLLNFPLRVLAKPARSEAYKAFIRRWYCIGCHTRRLIAACHTGPHGLGTKASDRDCVPLCPRCHREFDANPVLFLSQRGIDLPALLEMFHSIFDQETEKEQSR